MSGPDRSLAREIAREHIQSGDYVDWFDELYTRAGDDASAIPWAAMEPSRALIDWLDDRPPPPAERRRALVVAGGLGDDASELARRGWRTTCFEVSPSAIAWSRRRFPDSDVEWRVVDLFQAPPEWIGSWDLVFEAFTIQNFRGELRERSRRQIGRWVAPGGALLVVTNGRDDGEPLGAIPWPQSPEELDAFDALGLRRESLVDAPPDPRQPGRLLVGTWRAPSPPDRPAAESTGRADS